MNKLLLIIYFYAIVVLFKYCFLVNFSLADDHYVENKKVTNEKLSDEDHSIFQLFGCDKSCKYYLLLFNI